MRRLFASSYARFQRLLLLALLGPLMLSLFWVAVRFPVFYPDHIYSNWHEVQPEKLFVIFENYGKGWSYDSRAWLLDIEAETLESIKCPEEFGGKWPKLNGKDASGNLIFETQWDGPNYVGWNARTGVRYRVSGISTEPILINSRYLACTKFEEAFSGNSFVWCDLSQPERPPCRFPIMETNSTLIPVEGTSSFYFVLPANDQYWPDADLSEGGYGVGSYAEGSYGDDGGYGAEWVNEDGPIEYELPPVVTNPNAPKPLATVVLMNLTEQGPKEVARWPVVSDSSSEVTAAAGYVVCQSIDARFIETHDARNGKIVARIPVPITALDTTLPTPRLDGWSLFGTIIQFADGCGNRVAFDCKTGSQIDSLPIGAGWLQPILLGQHHEYLAWLSPARPADWPGEIQVRSVENHQVLYSWSPPEPNISFYFGSPTDGNPKFANDGRSVYFVTWDMRLVYADKRTGGLVRHIQPRFWVPFIAAALAVATGVWTFCWITTSIRDQVPWWVDVFMILGCTLSFLYWRINYSGDPHDEQRPAWISMAALVIALLVLIVDRASFNNARLLYRCSPIIVLAVASIKIQRTWLGKYSADLIVFELFLLAFIVTGSIAFHALFLRAPGKTQVASAKPRRVSLRELFVWMALVSLILAAFKLYDLKDWTRGLSSMSIVNALLYAGVITTVSLAAYYLTARRSGLALRLLGIGTLALLTLVSAVYRVEWDAIPYRLAGIELERAAKICECVVLIALASILIALPISMRAHIGMHNSTDGQLQVRKV
jgi:hypothetical protein